MCDYSSRLSAQSRIRNSILCPDESGDLLGCFTSQGKSTAAVRYRRLGKITSSIQLRSTRGRPSCRKYHVEERVDVSTPPAPATRSGADVTVRFRTTVPRFESALHSDLKEAL